MRYSILFSLVVMVSFGFSQNTTFEKGEVLIQLKNETDQVGFIRKFETEQRIGIFSFQQLSAIANIYQVVFTNENQNLNAAISSFYEYQAVINAQKNNFITPRETIPADTLFAQQWFHKNTGQTGGTVDTDIDTPEAWDITTGGVTTHGDTIVVCIIEGGGVDIWQEDLQNNIWHNYAEIPENGLDDDNNGYVDDFDGWNVSSLDDEVGVGSHGTRVAGMIGAQGDNITGISGVNWNVKMMVVKGQVASNEASVIAAYDYPLVMRKRYNESFGQEGAFVVVTNASWGIDNGDPANSPLWCAMYDTLGTYGILNVAATTNNNSNVDVNGDLPTACPSNYLIGVTMTDHMDIRANSGYGPTHVDLAAPGSSVLLPLPGNSYSSTSGTSFASPCVAGSIALAYSSPCPSFINQVKNDPAMMALDMKNYILSGADIIPTLADEVVTGGRLNIKNSIDSLMANCWLSACTTPYSLHANFITDTTAKFSWGGFSTDYLFYIQEGLKPLVEIPLVNQDSILFDTLIPCTQYTFWVKAICATDTSDFSFPLELTTDGCCNNPPIKLDNASIDSLTISWHPVLYATTYDIRYRKEGDASWINTLLDTVSPLPIGNLDTCTTYEFQIKTVCTDSTHGFSPSFLHSTKGCGACYEADYCPIAGGNASLEWIDSVVVNSYISATGFNNGYYNSSSIFTGFVAGQTYPIVLKPGYSGTTFTERFTVWIDLDHNGIFETTDALLENITTTTIINENITIPIMALDGITKMRIGMNGTGNPIACPIGSFWGEYEDYCVYIGEDAGINTIENNILLYPNPATNQINIESIIPIQQLRIYAHDGKLIKTVAESTAQIDVSELHNGIYIIHLQTETGSSVHKFIKQ